MKDKVFITCSNRGAKKMSKKRPSLRAGEIFIEVDLNVNDQLFRQVMPRATVNVIETKKEDLEMVVSSKGNRKVGLEI